MSGGLGNQMFQYAFGKMLQKKYGGELYLDTYFYLSHKNRSFVLDQYKVVYAGKDNYTIYNKMRRYIQRIPLVSTVFGIHKEKKEFQMDSAVYKYRYKYYTGYWQNLQYFINDREALKKDLVYVGDLTEEQIRFANILESEDSVAVHVRRSDYKTEKYNTVYYQLGESYYRNALQYLRDRNGGKQFKIYFFSDDIEWCKETYKDIDNAEFIDHCISGSQHVDMLLMRKCRYMIMANSTFSWWAAWLSDRKDSVVIMPENWYYDKRKNERVLRALVDDAWIVLK